VDGGTASRAAPALGQWVAGWAGLGLVTGDLASLWHAQNHWSVPDMGSFPLKRGARAGERSAPRRDTETPAAAARAEASTEAVPRNRRAGNLRELDDYGRFVTVLRAVARRRLTYTKLTGNA
jgi:hypothetical protein